MIEVLKFQVRSLDINKLGLQWEIADTLEDVLDYTFQILRSESPGGPWDPITPVFEDRYAFVDARPPVGYKFRQLYYTLRVTRKSTQVSKDFGPQNQGSDIDLVAAYIRRAEETLLRTAIGRRCWLFPARSFGTRCGSCYDPVLRQRTRAGCPDCFDTGFLRGYLNPIETWIQIDPSSNSLQTQAYQEDQQNTVTARMSHYPIVKPRDMVVELENHRWRVVGVTASERLRAVVKQELSLREIQPTDIEYRVPVNISDIMDVQASPPRMFNNPHNLDNTVDERIGNPFAYYATDPPDIGN